VGTLRRSRISAMHRPKVFQSLLILALMAVGTVRTVAQTPAEPAQPQPDPQNQPVQSSAPTGPVATAFPITPDLWVETTEQMKATGNVEVRKGEPVSVGWRAPRDTEHFFLVLTSPTGTLSTYPIKKGQNSVKLSSSKAAGTLQLKSGLKIIASVKIIVTE
jgi:hypothetical protein